MPLYENLPVGQQTGEVLQDKTDWKTEKLRSGAVSLVMPTIKRQERIDDCSTLLKFAVDAQGNKRLYQANFCRDRMCPACQRRRSLKVFHQIKSVCGELLARRPSTVFMMLTLTVPNVHESDLSRTLSHMFKSWDRLTKRKEVKKILLGWFRSLEVTKEKKRDGYYHPHFHILLAVPSIALTRNYIKQERWLELWREATRQPEIMAVDIRRVRPSKKLSSLGVSDKNSEGGSSIESVVGAAAEVGKYATKPSDYLTQISPDQYVADKEIVSVLSVILKGRRIISFGGILKTILLELDQEDVDSDDVDLLNTGDDSNEIDAIIIQVFKWYSSHKSYIS
jgi:plasmid rolling circle replication initiator protein Rep